MSSGAAEEGCSSRFVFSIILLVAATASADRFFLVAIAQRSRVTGIGEELDQFIGPQKIRLYVVSYWEVIGRNFFLLIVHQQIVEGLCRFVCAN